MWQAFSLFQHKHQKLKWYNCTKTYKKPSCVSLGIKYENTTRRKETVITRLAYVSGFVVQMNIYIKLKFSLPTDVMSVKLMLRLRHLLLDCPVSPLCGKVLDICTSFNMSPDLKVILQNRKILDAIYSNIKRAIYPRSTVALAHR